MDRWSQLSLKDKSDLMSLYIQNGISSLEEIKKHYNSFAQGGSLPDHDPDNPYHYHNAKGEKIVITPEDWEANVGKPYFKEIEDAVRAEQTAHPVPEYEINPNFVRDLRSTYGYNMGNSYQNYRNFSSSLPQGYSFTDEGLIVDPQGNYYVQSGYRQTPRFTYSTDNPLRFTINKGKPIERNLTFYPVNMDRTAKAPQPVDRTWKAPQLPSILENLSPEALKFIEKKYYEGTRLNRYWTDRQEQLKKAAKYGIDSSRLRTIDYKPTTNEWQGVSTPFYALSDDFVINRDDWFEGTPKEVIDFFSQYHTLGDFRRATGIKQLPLNGKYEEVKLPKIFKDDKDKYTTLLQADDDLVQEQRNKYFGFADGGHLYQDGGPDDPPSWYKPLTVAGTTPETSDNTYVYNTIADSQIDRREGLPKGTTTARKAMLTKVQPVIEQKEIPEDTQKEINRAIQFQKVIEPINQTLDVAENIPVLGDAITVGRTAADVKNEDYTTAMFLPLMLAGNKIHLHSPINNMIKNIKFNRSTLPSQIIKDIQNATNDNAQRYVQRQQLLGNIAVGKQMAEFLQPDPIYHTSIKDWFKYNEYPVKNLFNRTEAFTTLDGKHIVMNPLSILKTPNNYKGIVAHEAQHSFKYPGMPQVSVPTEYYYGPNPSFPYYNLLKPFENASLTKKTSWMGSPEELVSEMANWKYRRHVLDTPYYLLEEESKRPFIKEASKRFNIATDEISNTLEGLSLFGFFNNGGKLNGK